jgi:TRAP-type C4-dicarboxylate transport system permease small subunit
MDVLGRTLRRVLDALYLTGGVIAALFMLAILGIIVLQMLARWFGFVFPGATDYAGYSMAAASFFAFAYALNHGAHIRVSLVLSAMGRHRKWGELFCFAVGAVTATYLAWFAVRATRWSHQFGDISQGLDKTPLWIPQLSMSIGSILLAIAFWDHLLRMLAGREHGIRADIVDQSHGE